MSVLLGDDNAGDEYPYDRAGSLGQTAGVTGAGGAATEVVLEVPGGGVVGEGITNMGYREEGQKQYLGTKVPKPMKPNRRKMVEREPKTYTWLTKGAEAAR